jgi:AbrB family looped-hinge helix DNA binding protein
LKYQAINCYYANMDAVPTNHTHAVRPAKEIIGALSKKNAVTIPVEVRRYLKIKTNDKIIFQLKEDGVEIKPMPMTLEETYGSVAPINRPENFKQIRDEVIEEHVQKVIDKMNS